MTRLRSIVLFLSAILMVMSCNEIEPNETIVDSFSLLNGNEFSYEIDRISKGPDVYSPHDDLNESDYEETNDGMTYHVHFSVNGKSVTIDPADTGKNVTSDLGSIQGKRTNAENNSLFYELSFNGFLSGRFIVWKNTDGFEAELTLYGSGVPIIQSERGYLINGSE